MQTFLYKLLNNNTLRRVEEYIMKNIKKLVSSVLISVFVLSVTGCNMIEKTPEAIANSTVAQINNEKITRGELDNSPEMFQLIAQFKAQYGDNYTTNTDAMTAFKTQKGQLLDQMITERLVLQKAKELNIGQDEKAVQTEVDAQYAEAKKNYTSETEFTSALTSSGYTETSLKAHFKNEIIINKVVDYITKDVTVTDKAVQDYYNANMSKYTEKPNQIDAAHILVATQAEALKVKARIDAGEDFAKVAKEVSLDTATKDKGGDLGFVPYIDSGLEANFINAAIALKVGQVSAPVQTSYGFHIIKCIAKQEYPVKKFDAAKAEVKTTVLDQAKTDAVTAKVAEWKKAASITKYDNNLM
jgi:foldase protein PrsA